MLYSLVYWISSDNTLTLLFYEISLKYGSTWVPGPKNKLASIRKTGGLLQQTYKHVAIATHRWSNSSNKNYSQKKIAGKLIETAHKSNIIPMKSSLH